MFRNVFSRSAILRSARVSIVLSVPLTLWLGNNTRNYFWCVGNHRERKPFLIGVEHKAFFFLQDPKSIELFPGSEIPAILERAESILHEEYLMDKDSYDKKFGVSENSIKMLEDKNVQEAFLKAFIANIIEKEMQDMTLTNNQTRALLSYLAESKIEMLPIGAAILVQNIFKE